jgi:hypothetical protein
MSIQYIDITLMYVWDVKLKVVTKEHFVSL